MLEKWAIVCFIGVALFFTGFIRGCTYEQEKWELLSAKAEAEAERETQRRIVKQNEALNKYRESEKRILADRNRANASVGLLQQSLAGVKCDSPTTQGGSPAAKTAIIAGQCVNRLVELAEVSDQSYAAGKLCEEAYDALSNRDQVRRWAK